METPYGEIPDNFVNDMSPQEMHDYLKKRYTRRSTLRAGAIVGGAAVASTLFWQQSTAWASTQAQPQWIAYGADPTSQMFVSWGVGTSTVAAPVTNATVRYGLDTTYGTTVQASTSTVPVPASPTGEPAENAKYNTVLLSGLAPGTTYHYQVSNDGGTTWSSDVPFTTARAGAVDFKWAATADEATSATVSGNIATLIAAQKPEFVLVAGDLSYASGGTYPAGKTGSSASGFSPAAWDAYLGQIGPNAAQSIPWLVGVGNHELEPLDDNGYIGFVTRFPQDYTPKSVSGSPVAQSFTRGNVGFINLDANDLSAEITQNNGYTGGLQTSWFESVLKSFNASGSGIDFIVVFFHNCVFCTNQTHGSDDGVRSVWQPLFDKYNVDLVINGHVHAYERTLPIKGTTVGVMGPGNTVDVANQGTTYILAGGGGQSLYTSWYGPTLGGDAGSTTGPKKYQFSGSESATGGTGSVANVADNVTGYSAYRRAQFSFITADVVAPTAANKYTTTMTVKAFDPTQTGTTNAAGVVSTAIAPAVMDTVVLTRTASTRAASATASLPDVATPAILVVGGAAIGAAYLAKHRRDMAQSEPATSGS